MSSPRALYITFLENQNLLGPEFHQFSIVHVVFCRSYLYTCRIELRLKSPFFVLDTNTTHTWFSLACSSRKLQSFKATKNSIRHRAFSFQ